MNDGDTRLASLTFNNRFWLESYVSTKKTGQSNIKTDLISLFEVHFGDISTVSLNELESYFQMFKNTVSDTTLNNTIDRCRRFFEYISIKHEVDLNFDPADLKLLKVNKQEIKINRAEKPLKVSDIAKLRRMLQDDDLKNIVFEMAYQFGCTLEELEQISMKSYDFHQKSFKFKKRKIYISEDIDKLILNNKKVLSKKSKETYSDYFRLIGERAKQLGIFDDRGLMWSDIKATRKDNFLRCAECENIYENSSENWVLVKFSYEPSDKKWIVCKNCGSRGLKHG